MITYYDTEKEAKEVLAKLPKTPKEWCPLAQDRCRIDCVCYIEAHTSKAFFAEGSKYRIVEGYCNNEMFTYTEP